MNNLSFQDLIEQTLKTEAVDVKQIEYDDQSKRLAVQLKTNVPIAAERISNLKNNITTHLAFLTAVDVQIESNPVITSLESNWGKVIGIIKQKNPAVASILKRSDVQFSEEDIEITFEDKGLEGTFYAYETDTMINKICKHFLNRTYAIRTSALKDEFEGFVAFEKSRDEAMDALIAAVPEPAEKEPVKRSKVSFGDAIYKKKIKREITQISDVHVEKELYAIEGELVGFETRALNNGKALVKLFLSDYTNAIGCKLFLKDKEAKELEPQFKKGQWYVVEGENVYDTYDKEQVLMIRAINQGREVQKREDHSEEKRIELHMHTNMSEMDGIAPVKKMIQTAIEWGHPAIAVTDHGVLQAFPDAAQAAGDKIKVLYGLEGYLIDDESDLIADADDYSIDDTFVVFDIETTGFSYCDDKIIEIGAVKVKKGVVIEEFSQLIYPERPVPAEITDLTHISDSMLEGMPTIETVLPDFMKFIDGVPVVAHNATFDCSFIRYNCEQQGLPFASKIVDTLALSRLLLTTLKRHNLKAITKHLRIVLNDHHRAVADAEATSRVLSAFFERLHELNITTLEEINAYAAEAFPFAMRDTYHVILIAQTQQGLRNLYELVSHSSLETFYRRPRIPKRLLSQKREGLLIGSACEAGEVFRAMMNNLPESEVVRLASYYDYLEIQPIDNNAFMIDSRRVKDRKALQDMNRRILALGDQLAKPVVATGDVHFLNPEDEVYRRILMAGKGFDDADNQAPLYFRTTEEMMAEFSYLGDRTREVVIDNPMRIADSCEDVRPVPKGTFPPVIEGADEEFRSMCLAKAHRIYGDPLPEIVEKRLTRELTSIIGNGYAVMYIIAQKLVTKSLEDGFLVGSRGSVGSSFAATMSDITEVNPLPPHYICEHCKHSEFHLDGTYEAGVDMPRKMCPNCGNEMKKDGFDIPFETFLGFNGDKEPDIDLNFAGIYQANAHKYCEVLFGKGKTFKAGTIGTIAEKTAYGYVKKYFEERNLTVHRYEIERLAQGLTGVKRTSGQHPGGIMVVPQANDIHEFTPIQYPANDVNSDVVTTHFDYHSISGRLLKLDILGHDVPTIIKYLERMTGVDVFNIPLDDDETMELFLSEKSLNIVDSEYRLDIGSLGIPEFGTRFVRQMLKDTNPKTFSDLVRISGLSHGTDVWLNNAQNLIKDGTVTIKNVIATRDDIMNYLLQMKLEPLSAFKIMENVRKGRGLTETEVSLMKEHGVPEWYIKSCQTIQYMFPKAHAVAYVMMSIRIAYFKVHHPLAFYATFFMNKVEDFDADLICRGVESVRLKMKEIDAAEKPSKKEQDIYAILEIAEEFYARGLHFMKVNLDLSDAEHFKIVDDKLLPPFLALQGVGASAAASIAEVRDTQKEFLSIEDFQRKTKVSKTVIEAMKAHGCFDGLPEDNQLSLFSFA
jgi:DNA polymerase-3 subunit alpha (Gram-positive type)